MSGFHWCMLSIDIENLKIFNECYGRNKGNELIVGVANCLQNFSDVKYSVAGYFGEDDFALLMPYDERKIELLDMELKVSVKRHSSNVSFLPAIGVYKIMNPDEPLFTMYDRAVLARSAVKGNYTVRIKEFDKNMLDSLTSNYLLFSDVQRAFQSREFTFFLQPKCNMRTGKIRGAEVLVRWVKKSGEIVSPGVFIPFFEKSGFISELDPYIWEEVCKFQRSLLDRGKKPVPISVNVSRVDIYTMDVPAYFDSLIQAYALDPKLIELEITESAYTEDDGYVKGAATDLRKRGFRVLMDDFGSGYSSLNMLKNIEVDILKIDMRFLKLDQSNASKGIGILEAIYNMAQLIDTDVVIEGVETADQNQSLLKMGFRYAQGYYFYRPMPASDFEAVIANEGNLDHEEFQNQKIEELRLKDLLSADIFSENMLNNMLGAMAFYEVRGHEVTLRRYNEQWAVLTGTLVTPGEKIDFNETVMYPEDRRALAKMFQKASEEQSLGAECDVRRRRADGSVQWLHLCTFLLKARGDCTLYYSSLRDVTDIYQKNELLVQKNEELHFMNNDMPGGYYRHMDNDGYNFLHISQRFLDIVGYSENEIKSVFQGKFLNMIHPDDRAPVRQGLSALKEFGGTSSLPFRIRTKHGYVAVVEQSRMINDHGSAFYQGIIFHDIDRLMPPGSGADNTPHAEQVKGLPTSYDPHTIPCGIYQAEADGARRFSYVSGSLLAILGYSKREFLKKFGSTEALIFKEDLPAVEEDARKQVGHSQNISYEHRVELADGGLKWFYSVGRLTVDGKGKRWINVCLVESDYLREKYSTLDWTFFEKLHESVYVCDMETYELEYMNQRCLEQYGYASLNEVREKKCYEVLQKNAGPCAFCTNQHLKQGEFYEWQFTNPVSGRTYMLKDTMLERAGRRLRMELAVDVSTQEGQRRELQDYTNNESLIHEGLRVSLSQPTPEGSIAALLEYIGRHFKSQRAYIFEEEDGNLSNTYEWCAEGVTPQKDYLQQVPFEVAALWYRSFHKNENVVITELEATREKDFLMYETLKPQGICSLVVCPIMEGKKITGFFGVDNPPAELLGHISVALEVIGHFIASLLQRRDLVRRLAHLSYYDQLTGLKNRHAMDEFLMSFKAGESIGVVYLDVMGLKKVNDIQGHQSGDELLKKASQHLRSCFAGNELFRVGGDEFLVLCKGESELELEKKIARLRNGMQKNEAFMAIGHVWAPRYESNLDELLKEADTQMYHDKKAFYATHPSGNCRKR